MLSSTSIVILSKKRIPCNAQPSIKNHNVESRYAYAFLVA
jgi:hypothetical protein